MFLSHPPENGSKTANMRRVTPLRESFRPSQRKAGGLRESSYPNERGTSEPGNRVLETLRGSRWAHTNRLFDLRPASNICKPTKKDSKKHISGSTLRTTNEHELPFPDSEAQSSLARSLKDIPASVKFLDAFHRVFKGGIR